MTALELAEQLERMVEKYGDLEVHIQCEDEGDKAVQGVDIANDILNWSTMQSGKAFMLW
jgi:hypothetical protein